MNGGNIKANIIDNCYTFNNICGNSDLSTIIAVRDKTTTVAYKTISEGQIYRNTQKIILSGIQTIKTALTNNGNKAFMLGNDNKLRVKNFDSVNWNIEDM